MFTFTNKLKSITKDCIITFLRRVMFGAKIQSYCDTYIVSLLRKHCGRLIHQFADFFSALKVNIPGYSKIISGSKPMQWPMFKICSSDIECSLKYYVYSTQNCYLSVSKTTWFRWKILCALAREFFLLITDYSSKIIFG